MYYINTSVSLYSRYGNCGERGQYVYAIHNAIHNSAMETVANADNMYMQSTMQYIIPPWKQFHWRVITSDSIYICDVLVYNLQIYCEF
jgi:6-phosphogluconate dehydrogenase (decarboxylating)